MAAKFVAAFVFLGLMLCLAEVDDAGTHLRAHGQWAAFQIANLGSTALEVKNANLEWGKWYAFPDQNKEISSPNGVKLPARETSPKIPFAASGRDSALSGTEGTFDLYEGTVKVATIYFDCPWSGKNDLQTKFSCSNCIVQIPSFSTEGALGTLVIKVFKMPALMSDAA